MLVANPAHRDWYEGSAVIMRPLVAAHNEAGKVYDRAYHFRYYGEEGRQRYRDALQALDESWDALQAGIAQYEKDNPKPPVLIDRAVPERDGDEAWHEWKAKPDEWEGPGRYRNDDHADDTR